MKRNQNFDHAVEEITAAGVLPHAVAKILATSDAFLHLRKSLA